MPDLSPEEKLAQLFLVGSDTADFTEEIEPFYRFGLGGLLLFRHHTQPFITAQELKDYLDHQHSQFQGAGLGFIGIDQEGGQVERIPHWYFPSGVLPVTLGLTQNVELCRKINNEVAKRLRWLGINLNFTPTVDLNVERHNPIIGVRAYGQTPQQVIPFAQVVMQSHLAQGVLPVAKHFPGHGSGTVDSHLDLPVFERWSDVELEPYKALIAEGLPAVLVAHGVYPQLPKDIISQLLRNQLNFEGLVFTDDLTMGAIHKDADPVEVALNALTAGADVLVYRRAQPEAWLVFEALCARIKSGKLSESLIDDKLSRILTTQTRLKKVPATEVLDPENPSLTWAQACLVELKHQYISPLPLNRDTRWALVYPDRNTMVHYAPDQAHGTDLPGWCQSYGISPVAKATYPVFSKNSWTLPEWEEALDVIVFVAFNSLLDTYQQAAYHQLRQRYPNAKLILASCGMPTDIDVMPDAWVHLALPSFRPSAMEAFAMWLTQPVNA